MKNKTLIVISLSIIGLLIIFYYIVSRNIYINDGLNYIKVEKIGNNLHITPLLIETMYGISKIEYSIEGNDINIWLYKKYYKFLNEKLFVKKIPLEKDFEYNIYYKNKDGSKLLLK